MDFVATSIQFRVMRTLSKLLFNERWGTLLTGH